MIRVKTGDYILLTKIIPPKIPKQVILRERLLNQLKNNLEKRLILISADAGYGKTTLLAQLVATLKIPYVWYHIDESDRDLNTFLRYLTEGLKRFNPQFGTRILNILDHSEYQNLEVAIGTFINELIDFSQNKILFIFDDFHHLYNSEEILKGIKYLIKNIPPNVSIAISTRSNPPFPLENLLFKNELLEIDCDDLRFDNGEIRTLFERLIEYSPSPDEVERIRMDSEGWITYLQFLIKSRAHRSGEFYKSEKSLHHRLYDYFEKEVFLPLNENLKHFLIAVSILRDLSPEVCNYLTDSEDADKILGDLQKRHLFITSYDGPEISYRFHHLFRDFLLRKIRITDDFFQLHKKAGIYFEKVGNLLDSIDHYFEARANDKAILLIKKVGNIYISEGKIETVNRWLDRLPEELVISDPLLLLLNGRLKQKACDWDQARDYLLRSQRMFKKCGDETGYLEAFYNSLALRCTLGKFKGILPQINRLLKAKVGGIKYRIKFLNLMGRVLIYLGRMEESINRMEEMLRLAKRSADKRLIRLAMHNLGISHLEAGNFSKCQSYLKRLVPDAEANPTPFSATLNNNYGYALMMEGNYQEAEKRFIEAQRYARLFNDKQQICYSYTHFGILNLYKRKIESAKGFLKKAEEIAMEIKHPFHLAGVWKGLAEALLMEGKIFEAKRCIDKTVELPLPTAALAPILIIKAKVELSIEDIKHAEDDIYKAYRILKRSQSKYEMTRCLLYLGLLRLRKRDEKKAKRYLAKCIAIAEYNDYDHLLLREARYLPDLFRHIRRFNIEPHYINHILANLPVVSTKEIFSAIPDKNYSISIMLFGKTKVFRGENELKIQKWRTKKFLELFLFLAVNRGNGFIREKILAQFWPEHKPEKAQQLFHNALYHIRRVTGLKDIILYQNGEYRFSSDYRLFLDIEKFESDIIEGKKLIESGNQISGLVKIEEGISLYHGSFMDDFYSDWCQEKRYYYEAKYLESLRLLGSKHLKIKNYMKALDFYKKIVDHDPYDEEAHCGVMHCYSAMKNLGGVIKQFNHLKETLARDLKTGPHPETIKTFKLLVKTR